MRIPTNILEHVNYGRLKLNQRLNCNIIDLLEGFSIDISKIFSLEFLNQFLLCPLQICLPDSAIIIKSKPSSCKALMNQDIALFWSNDLSVD